MKLGAKKLLLISFMLFSLFFGAGNLIFPPFLGQSAGSHTAVAFIGFLITAVILPVLGVIVVAKFNGLENLGSLVSKKFAIVFAVVIYLSIGPGLGIPRAGSLPFEMAVAPFLPESMQQYNGWFMLLYSAIFFGIALWLCFTPGKLVKRIGTILTPSLLTLIVVLFISFLIKGDKGVAAPTGPYDGSAFLQGFCDGYLTMDAIAALNFGLVIATTLTTFGVGEKKGIMKHTVIAGIIAGSILAFVYFMLAYMGANSSAVYPLAPGVNNGAPLLRDIVTQLFGLPGAILLAAIFTLACLTTCVGLINSISMYFSTLFKKISYRKWVIIITVFSFLVCNLGLSLILKISVPVLDIVYPISIALIFFGLTNKVWDKVRAVYPATIAGIAVVSIFTALIKVLREAKVNMGGFDTFLHNVPLFDMGFFWVIIALIILPITAIVCVVTGNNAKKKALASEACCVDCAAEPKQSLTELVDAECADATSAEATDTSKDNVETAEDSVASTDSAKPAEDSVTSSDNAEPTDDAQPASGDNDK